MITVVSPSSLGEWKAESQGLCQWQESELSKGAMAIKLLTELRNGWLSSGVWIKHLSSWDGLRVVQEPLTQLFLLKADSPDRDVFPFIHGVGVYWAGIQRQNSVPTFTELTVYLTKGSYRSRELVMLKPVWIWCTRRGHVKWLVKGALRNYREEELLALNNQERLWGRGCLKTVLAWERAQNPWEAVKALRWGEELSQQRWSYSTT